MPVMYRCWAEVDLGALAENLAWLRHRVGPRVRVLTVVKADAYGHGLRQIAALLMQSGTDIFGVANLAEAQVIRRVGKGWPVLMLGACLPHEVHSAVRDEIMPTVSSLAEAQAFSEAALRAQKTVRLHVKVDTGMGRLGIDPEKAGELIEAMERLPGVQVEGVFTHFAAAEDDEAFTRQQVARFETLMQAVRDRGILIPDIHASNSAALLHEPSGVANVVRPGLLVYGVVPPGKRQDVSVLSRHLRAALAWKCRVSLVKEVPAGTSLSYGRTFTTSRPTRVATLAAGYGDGYQRAGSNRASVLVGGRRCRVLGRVTMDQMLVDVTGLETTKAGDEAVLIGLQGAEAITANEVAEWWGTIPWEVLTNISHRVPRVYLGGAAA